MDLDTNILIVGAGPVGLTLAYDLGRRGTECTLIERKEEPQFLPKMERCNARTMEIYRRMGLADKIRAAGLPADIPMDVFIVLTMDRPPLAHFPHPSVDAARAAIAACQDGTLPLEPYQLISQYTLEPLLKVETETLPSVTVRYGCAFEELFQSQEGVTATVRNADGTTDEIKCSYLAGCDGGGSAVRKQIEVKLRGVGNFLRLHQALFRCDGLFDRIPIGDGPGKGRHYHVADEQATLLIMQDSTNHFTLHSIVENEDEMKAMFERTVAAPLDYEMLFCGEWRQNLLLADHYRKGRVFLAGDAAHLVPPTGGLGMNTGVGDATDLSWKLAAAIEGWAGPHILDSYEIERRHVGDRNVGAARYASLGRRKWRSLAGPDIFDQTPAGGSRRDNLAAVADVEQRKTNEMIGAELGYRYVDSPIIWNEPGGPENLYRDYHPTSWPGARLPHTWLEDGSAVQDHIPDGFVLLQSHGSGQGDGGLSKAFRKIGAPFSVVKTAGETARDVYEFNQILLRPDMHVVWRGNSSPEDPDHLAAVAVGHRMMIDG